MEWQAAGWRAAPDPVAAAREHEAFCLLLEEAGAEVVVSQHDPGNPDAADWTFRVYLDVSRHYEVDGIHFDFVRYGSTDGKGRFGYNPVSVARFLAQKGRWGDGA